ncbi:MAG: type II secretion system protein [Bacillota bacterium]
MIEVLAVLAILGILVAIAVPSVISLIEKSREDVCETNRLELGRMYRMHLDLEGKEHTPISFHEYFLNYGSEICPSGGEISYEDGDVKCSIHSHNADELEEPGEENEGVPFL